MKAIHLIPFIAFTLCSVINVNAGYAQSHTIHFLDLHIQANTKEGVPVITVLNKQVSNGILKKQPEQYGPAWLTMYVYSNGQVIDSLKTDHPLYKHLEYPDQENNLRAKDTVVNAADFLIRFQAKEQADEIQITETTKRTGVRKLATIRL